MLVAGEWLREERIGIISLAPAVVFVKLRAAGTSEGYFHLFVLHGMENDV